MLDYIVTYANGRAVAYHSPEQALDEVRKNPGAKLSTCVCGHFDHEAR